MGLRTFVMAGLVCASLNAAATASPPDTESAKTYVRFSFFVSADHVHVVIASRGDAEEEIIIFLPGDGGFHINANPASQPYLLPTTVTFRSVTPLRILYIVTRFRPKFVDKSIDVFQGVVAITTFLPKGTLAENQILCATQTGHACNDIICLPPSDLPLTT